MKSIYKAWFRQAVQSTRHGSPGERAHLAVGRFESTGAPTWMPRASVQELMLILGSAGGGKSSLINGLAELTASLGDTSIIAADLKSLELVLYWCLVAG